MNTSRFVYSVLRYMPDAGKGEFVNIGALAGSEDLDQWDIRLTNHWTRVRALHRSASRACVLDLLRPLLMVVEENEKGSEGSELSESVLRALSSDPRSAVQVAPPLALLAEDVDAALDQVFAQLVPEGERQARGVGRRTVRRQLRAAFLAANLTQGQDFRENVQVVAERGFDGGMDVAITNGQVKGFVQAWSFDVQDRDGLRDEIRSWGYLVEKVRAGRSVILVGDREIEVATDAAVDAVYVAPTDEADATYADALRVFEDLQVTHQPVERARDVAQHALELLNRHG